MGSPTMHLNRVLYNIKEETSLADIKDLVTLEDIEEFLATIGFKWECWYGIDEYTDDVFMESIDDLINFLNHEYDDDGADVVYKNEALLEVNNDQENFLITSFIFHHLSETYQKTGPDDAVFFDKDYSVQWIKFLHKKYGGKYFNRIDKQLKRAIQLAEHTKTATRKEIDELKQVYNSMSLFQL